MSIDIVSNTPAGTDQALHCALIAAWETLAGFRVAAPQRNDLFVYFKSLDDVLTGLNEAGGLEPVEAAMGHIEYLAEKAGCHSAVILGGGHFTAHPQVILDALANIGSVLRTAAQKQPEPAPESIPEDVFALILEAEAKLAGWCSREKSLVIARTVLQERPKICVEIGVFGGRSLIPCAAALRHIGEGAIYGIEAWSPNVAIENPTNEANDDWWSKVDFTRIKQEFFRFVAATNLTQHVRVVEAPSNRVASLFDQIDYLHIDGSHSIVNAAEDVILYARKVRAGGIIIFDDINWQSTAPARALLDALCETVTVLKDPESGLDICAVLRRR
jgi:predicted O-methyltransferase YrrM